MACVYTLSCPFTGAVRYVGKSNGPAKQRYTNHIACGRYPEKQGNRQLYDWIHSLLEQGEKPALAVVETCECAEVKQAEKNWYRYYAGHAELFNLVDFEHRYRRAA